MRWAPKGKRRPELHATALVWHGYCVGMSFSPAAGVVECEEAIAVLRPGDDPIRLAEALVICATAHPQRTTVPHLTRGEQELYTCLADYAAVHDTGLLLEQERVPWPTAYPVLTRAMEQDSPEGDKD